MRPRARSAPAWFQCGVAIAAALLLRAWLLPHGAGVAAPAGPAPPALAFFGFFLVIGELIWKGLEVAGKVTLAFLKFTVDWLYLVVTKLKNGLGALGSALLQGLKRGWDFFRTVYDDVLKPAWDKFWRLFDRLRSWLKDTIGPVLDWLQKVRKYIIDFWATYVRPWLDLIDVTRKLLRVLASLGLTWARALDERLGRLEDQITKPFLFVLSKLNEVIGVVNSIVGKSGLLQRVALVRSIARDYEYVWRGIANPYQHGFDRSKSGPVDDAIKPRTAQQIARDYGAWVTSRTGDRADMYAAIDDAVRREFGSV